MTLVCAGCGKTIDSSFFFCPWCGFSRLSKNSREAADLRFEYHNKARNEASRKRFSEMKQELDNLEEELSVLVLSAEMAR